MRYVRCQVKNIILVTADYAESFATRKHKRGTTNEHE